MILLGLAVLSGLLLVAVSDLVVLFCGALCVFIGIVYSFGPAPISRLPLGEAVSGFVMGGVIPMGCWFVFTGQIRFDILLFALPLIVSIGLIMMTNNVSDIERDSASGRHTLPVLLGRGRTAVLLRALIALDFLLICGLSIWSFRGGLFVLPLMLLTLLPPAVGLFRARLDPAGRRAAMGNILAVHRRLGLGYALVILADFIRAVL
jgi:1,4-dihydroxy-2-naphthoate octaprenyltransferase